MHVKLRSPIPRLLPPAPKQIESVSNSICSNNTPLPLPSLPCIKRSEVFVFLLTTVPLRILRMRKVSDKDHVGEAGHVHASILLSAPWIIWTGRSRIARGLLLHQGLSHFAMELRPSPAAALPHPQGMPQVLFAVLSATNWIHHARVLSSLSNGDTFFFFFLWANGACSLNLLIITEHRLYFAIWLFVTSFRRRWINAYSICSWIHN